MSSLIGYRLADRYTIRAQVGRGGMGIVYGAHDEMLQRPVAIKVLAPQLAVDPQFFQRFQQEAITAANLRHPNIVTIHDVGAQPVDNSFGQSIHYIVMEYLDGVTLDQWLQGGGHTAALVHVERIVRQVADALQFAHDKGVIHRDVKPSNIMVGPTGHVTLMDFGLVRANESIGLTRTGVIVGTPEYMAPEQALGHAVDARTDIYSFGVVIYQMLAGQAPFIRPNSVAIAYAHVNEPPPLLRERRSDVPKSVEAVVFKALAKQPSDRYQQVSDLARDLALAVTGKMPTGLRAATAPPANMERAGMSSGSVAAIRPSPVPSLKTLSPERVQAPPKTSEPTEAVTMLGLPRVAQAPEEKRPARILPLLAVSALAVLAVFVLFLRVGVRAPASQQAVAEASRVPAAMDQPAVENSAGQQPAPYTPAANMAVPTRATNASTSPTPTTIAMASASRLTGAAEATARLAPAALRTKPPDATNTVLVTGAVDSTLYDVAPVSLDPSEGVSITGEQVFAWRWPGPPLRNDERFSWRLLRRAGGEDVVDSRTSTTAGLTYSFADLPAGEYYWTVRVIRVGANGEFLATRSQEAARRLLRWTPSVQIPPTNTAQSTSTPAPVTTNTARPSDTPVLPPTNTPRPSDTPVPPSTDTPRPTDTPAPTNTPRPSDTPVLPPTDTPRPTDTPAPISTDTPAPISTDTPTPPISWSLVPDADVQDLQTAGVGSIVGLGLFVAVIGLSSLQLRRRQAPFMTPGTNQEQCEAKE